MNDGKNVEQTNHQIMRWIFCYLDPINAHNPRIKERKGLITYHKTYGIISLKKHVDVGHSIIAKFLEEKVNNSIIESIERQLAK